jgi:ligand-binding sensor domain-containing protein
METLMFISRKMKLLYVMIFLLATFQLRAEITFTPDKPVVEMEEKITLSVSGTVGELTWSAQKGWIEGTDTTVSYIAPSQPGKDVVTVMDAEANVATVKIQINGESKDFSSENAVWEIFTNRDSIHAFALSKDKSTLWVGTTGGLEKRNASTGELEKVYINTDGLPDNRINALLSDEQGGVWVGTYEGGLAHLKADGSWQIFNKDNSNLPNNEVNALLSDEQGGVWVGTWNGLTHLKADGSWQIFKTDNSNLPSNGINSLLSDDQGGVWIGTLRGLAHLKADGSWQVFNEDNSNLPDERVYALLSDEQWGVWAGTDVGGLAHLKADGSWQVFNTDNSVLPDNHVEALLSDGQGGAWAGTYGGIAHLKADGYWQVFNTDNSNLLNNHAQALLSDDQGGVWVGTGNGLAHLKLREQQSGKRAAIIIAGGGNQAENTLWDTTESISTYFYKMLNNRKFVNSEIYYLSSHPWADFNGDGFDDKIVDAPRPARPITLDDVKKAFEWAKEQGKLDQPLYVFFIDHGGEGKLQLAKNTNMSAEEFKSILDDYQQATGNQVVLLLEACYSGSHLPILAAPNRAIISSAKGNELAYFEDKQGFSRFFTKNLLKGMNFLEAFNYSVQQQGSLLAKMDERLSGGSAESVATTQTPQCDDNGDGVYDETSDGQWLKQLIINGNIQTADFTLAVESLTVSSSLPVGEPFSLSAKASTASGHVKRVWAVIRPPRINLVLDSNGTPILAYPTQELSQTEEADIWTGTWSQAVYNGDYEISFYTKDNEGNIEMSEKSVVISVTGGIEPPASASVEIVIEKDQYARGEPFKFEFVEQLGWGYDLYVAVMLPDGQFITLEGPNEFAKPNQLEKWYKSLKYNEKVTAIDLTLPSELPTGEYCLYGILSPERENVIETLALDLWVMEQRCFEVY